MAAFKKYLGCELIRNRSAKTAKLVQRGYAERVLRTFGMWDCKPCATPLDANSRLSKKDCPQVVDPALHRRYRSITGCLSYLVNMTRPDLAFAYSQPSKFVQYPGVVHLQAAERVLQYVRGTYDQGITKTTTLVRTKPQIKTIVTKKNPIVPSNPSEVCKEFC
jgi:hypothetical protein